MNHKKLISVLLLCSFLLAGCGTQTEPDNSHMMEKSSETLVTEPVSETEIVSETQKETTEETIPETENPSAEISLSTGEHNMSTDFQKNQMNLAITLLRRQAEQDYDKNLLLSPVSISTALALTANGADNSTKIQMEQFFHQDIDSLNTDLKSYTDNLSSSEFAKCISANSVWIKQTDEISVREEFLKTGEETYQAGIFEEPFDSGTKDKINSWVSENTDNMIDNIIDDISPDSVMYLINALTFDAQWQNQYEDYQIEEDTFTAYDGTERTVSMMSSREWGYLDDGNATGFIKPYKEGKYEFIALLPNESTDIRNYLNTLDSEKLSELLQNPQDFEVDTKLPAFESEYDTSLKTTLQSMGIADAFSQESADFSRMADINNPEKNLYIDDVLHKTYISVDKNGTKAAAVTAVMVAAVGAAFTEEQEIKEVILNRPFVYIIADSEKHLPLFMGIVTDID